MIFDCGCGCNKEKRHCRPEDCFRPEEFVKDREYWLKETRVSTDWKRAQCPCNMNTCGCKD